MGIPNVPTDNLYKYVALSGLLGVFVCVFLTAQVEYRLQNNLFQRVADLAVVNADVTDMKAQLAENGPSDRQAPADRNRLSDLARRTAQWEVLKDQVAKLTRDSRKIWIISRIASLAFLIAAGWGFKRWYKLQRMQEELLAAEVAKLNPPGRAS